MIPIKISLQGFMTYRDRQTLNFDGSSLWVLAGPNGAGKSSVFDAITLALYNCHRAGKKNAKALINHAVDRLIVEFDFQVGDELYRVRRTVPRKGTATRQAFYLYPEKLNGSEVPIPDTQYEDGFERWVESTIGLKYETFISSVMLLQGQSTKLLDAAPKDRHQMLEEFVNLAAYKRLYVLADDQRKQFAGKLKDLEQRSQNSNLLKEEDLTESQAAMQAANDRWEAAKQIVDGLTAILEQSKHWQLRREEIDQHEKKLQQLRQLLERSAEIREKYDRCQTLKLVLPQLRDIFDSRGRIESDTRKIAQMTEGVQKLEAELERTTESHSIYQKEKTELEQQSQRLTQEKTAIALQIAELAPQLSQLSQLEEAEEKLEGLAKQLENYPADLTVLVEQTEAEEKNLLETKQSLPLLRQLTAARLGLSEALQAGTQTGEQIKQLEVRLIESKAKEEEIQVNLDQAEQTEATCTTQVTYAQKTYDDFCQKLERFETVAQQPICELCGQAITPEHAEQEYQHLSAKIEETLSALEQLKRQQQQARQTKQEIATRQSKCKQEIVQLQQDISLGTQRRDQLRDEFSRHKKQFCEAYNDLPEIYQLQIAAELSEDYQDWLATTYPTQQDLENSQAATKQLSSLSSKLKQLREQSAKRSELRTIWQQTSDRLSQIRDTLPLEDLTQIQPENDRLLQKQQELEQELFRIIANQEKNNKQCSTLEDQVKKLNQQYQQQQLELAAAKAAKAEVENALSAAINRLPPVWNEQTQVLDSLLLETLDQEYSSLHEYDNLHHQLDLAERAIPEEEQQINRLKAELEQIPLQAQRRPEEVTAELVAAKTQREQLQNQRDQSQQAWQEMKQNYLRQTQLQQEQMETEQQHERYKVLSKLLGPNYLQAHLLRQAETRIVELANETLDGLSRGRLRLELQSKGFDSGEAPKQALDLLVYDADTGNSPTAIALTSGSQRFRIAVSLALAIGRFAGQETRGIESVIIDEGFGGLDKNGRDDMITHLSELQQHLARIVLVSHQEEFASAFTNGYQIQLINGSSQVQQLNL